MFVQFVSLDLVRDRPRERVPWVLLGGDPIDPPNRVEKDDLQTNSDDNTTDAIASPSSSILKRWQQQRAESNAYKSQNALQKLQENSSGEKGASRVALIAGKYAAREDTLGGGARKKPKTRLYGADLVKFLEEQGLSKPKVTERRIMRWEVSSTGQWIVNGEVAVQMKKGTITVSSILLMPW